MTRRGWTALLVVGAAMVVVGVAIVLLIPNPASFGWTAYAPLSDVQYVPGPPRWSLLVAAGLLAAGAFVSGLAVASLRRRPGPRDALPPAPAG